MRILLDTDVCLDFVLERQPFFVEAKEIFKAIAQNKVEPFIASITIINIYYFGKKEKGRNFALQEVQKLLQLVEICPVNSNILHQALLSPVTDYEDAVQCESAIAENLDAIVTRNTKDFANSPILIYSPTEFLKQI